MSTPLLSVENLHAWYGESHVLHGINLEVYEGEVVTLLGRNGAGRTSTLRAILGLTSRRSGIVKIGGVDVIRLASHSIARLGVGYCPEERGIFASLSTIENLNLLPQVGSAPMGVDEIFDMFPNLKERAKSP
jgi:branched-chain amino acid transport system ATP-binding protein